MPSLEQFVVERVSMLNSLSKGKYEFVIEKGPPDWYALVSDSGGTRVRIVRSRTMMAMMGILDIIITYLSNEALQA
jgi:hypothetical protein